MLGGSVGSVPRASELVMVSAALGSTSSRKMIRTMLTPGTDFDSTVAAPGACTQRSMRLVMVFSTDEAGMPWK